MTTNCTAAEQLDLALDFIARMGATDAAIERAAYQYQIDRNLLVEAYDQQYRRWAASRGYDY